MIRDELDRALETIDVMRRSEAAVAARYIGSQAEIERLRAALEFYANPEIYRPHPHGPGFDRRDVSYVARAALSIRESAGVPAEAAE